MFFVTLVYVKFWHEAVVARWASKNDIDFLTILSQYPDKSVATTADKALRRHSWYVSERNVALAFFDERTDVEEKMKMKENFERTPSKRGLRRDETKDASSSRLDSLSMTSFVTKMKR